VKQLVVAILVCVAGTWALVALAAEVPIGTISAPADGGTVTNGTTALPFFVPYDMKLTLQSDQIAYVEIGRSGKRVTQTTAFSDAGAFDGGSCALLPDGGARCINTITTVYDPVTTTNTLSDGGLSLTAGLYLAQYEKFPTATPSPGGAQALFWDGGSFSAADAGGAPSSIVRARCGGSAACNINVYVRSGKE
jgi:hypothetical protein